MKIRCLYDKLVPIEELKKKFHPKNRNKHPQEQIERIAKILKYQGVRSPAQVSNQTDSLVVGEGRIRAAEKMGETHYPVNFQDFDSEEQESAHRTADNAIASWAELDLSGIQMDIKGLSTDFDVDLMGVQNFNPVQECNSELIEAVNQGDENSEWSNTDMPDFQKSEDHVKLIFQFSTELEREIFVKQHKFTIDRKMNNQWIVNR